MAPTLQAGDTVQVEDDPDTVGVGDVVVFRPPRGAESNSCGVQHTNTSACPRPTAGRSPTRFLHRIVAKEGDQVKILEGRTYIDGERRQPGVGTDPERVDRGQGGRLRRGRRGAGDQIAPRCAARPPTQTASSTAPPRRRSPPRAAQRR